MARAGPSKVARSRRRPCRSPIPRDVELRRERWRGGGAELLPSRSPSAACLSVDPTMSVNRTVDRIVSSSGAAVRSRRRRGSRSMTAGSHNLACGGGQRMEDRVRNQRRGRLRLFGYPVLRVPHGPQHQDGESKGRKDLPNVVLVQQTDEPDRGPGPQACRCIRARNRTASSSISPPDTSGERTSRFPSPTRPRRRGGRRRPGRDRAASRAPSPSDLRPEPDQPCGPFRMGRGEERRDHATVARREQRRTLLTGRVKDRTQVRGTGLEIGESAHVVGQSRTAPIVEAEPRDRRELQP